MKNFSSTTTSSTSSAIPLEKVWDEEFELLKNPKKNNNSKSITVPMLLESLKKLPESEANVRRRRLDDWRRSQKFSSLASSTTDHSIAGSDQQYSTEQLLQNQNMAILQQDEAFDNILSTIQEVKSVATGIGEEANLHTRLLDDLENDVEDGHHSLNRETKQLDLVSQRSDTSQLRTAICILIFIFIVMVCLKL